MFAHCAIRYKCKLPKGNEAFRASEKKYNGAVSWRWTIKEKY